MQCIRCGKEMFTSSSNGDNVCSECKNTYNSYHINIPNNCDIPLPQGFGKPEGWICPVCGRGVAPHVDVCPCRKDAGVINVTTTTSLDGVEVDLTKYYTLINDGTVPEAKFNYEDTLEG